MILKLYIAHFILLRRENFNFLFIQFNLFSFSLTSHIKFIFLVYLVFDLVL